MKKYVVSFSVFLSLIFFSQKTYPACLYCSPSGNDSNPGTPALPYRSPGFASRRLLPGDTLVILRGRYKLSRFDEDILSPPAGRPGAWVTLLGEPENRPVLAGRDNLFCAVFLNSWLRIKNIEITADSGAFFRDGLNGTDGPLKQVVLENVVVHHIDGMALDVQDVDSLTVADCAFSYCGFGGIGGPLGEKGGLRHVTVEACTLAYSGHYYQGIPDNPDLPYDRPDGFGIEPSDGPIDIVRTLSEHNRGDGLDSKAANTIIRQCIVANNYGDGIKLWADGGRIVNTLIYGTGDGDAGSPWSGIVIDHVMTEGARFEIVNCTVHDNPERQAYPLYSQYPPSSVPIRLTLRNTIVSGGHGPVFFGECVDLTCENNLFNRPGEDVQVVVRGREYGTADILNDSLGPGNRVGDPLFMRPAWGSEGDYHLGAGSPGLDCGKNEPSPASDLEGTARPQGRRFDLGCYEAIVPSSVAGKSAVNPEEFHLLQCHPNPFNQTTLIEFRLRADVEIRLTLMDAAGRRIFDLADGRFSAGPHRLRLDASALASGVYFCRLVAGAASETVKLTVLK